jgi:nucleotide-binding universal stress UspA family protein
LRSPVHDGFSHRSYFSSMTNAIVVPLDGSGCAEHAFEYAVGLAKAGKGCLEICSFVDPIEVVGRDLPEPLEEAHVAAAKAQAERVVREAIAKAAADGVVATGCVKIGEPAAGIIELAGTAKAGSIVMGTHGRSGFKRLFMGSVAEEVLRRSPCPVVIIREKARSECGTVLLTPPQAGNEPVSVLRLVEVSPADYERLYGEIASFMSGPGAELPGLIETQLFGSIDATRIVILTKFLSHKQWVRAQWDARLGALLEEIEVNAETLEFNVYHGDRFPAKALVAH